VYTTKDWSLREYLPKTFRRRPDVPVTQTGFTDFIMSDDFLSLKTIRKKYNLSRTTLLSWEKKGTIEVIKTPSGHRRYKIDKVFGGALTSKRRKIAYCRVSSPKQKKDLQSQKTFMQEKYPEHEIFSDIGSGINFKRKSFRKMVQLVLQGSVEELVVSHRDRLCRIAFSFFEWLCTEYNTKLLVQDHDIRSAEEELTDDLLSIIHVFSCRRYGIRRYRTKDTDKGDKGQDPPEQGTREDPARLVPGRKEDLQPSDPLDEDV